MDTPAAVWREVLDNADLASAELMMNLFLEDVGVDLAKMGASDDEDEINEPETEETTEPVNEKEAETYDCVICETAVPESDCCKLSCDHHHCKACLDAFFHLVIADETAYTPRCCTDAMAVEEVEGLLEKQLLDDFKMKREEYEDDKRTYCSSTDCASCIGKSQKVDTVATCPNCDTETCVLCKKEMHEGDCEEDEAVDQTLELAKEHKWQKCPCCARMIELSVECYHIVCLCKSQFCYACGAIWKTCICPQFEERSLLEPNQEIV